MGINKKEAELQANLVTSQQPHLVVVKWYFKFQISIWNSKYLLEIPNTLFATATHIPNLNILFGILNSVFGIPNSVFKFGIWVAVPGF